MLDLALQDLRRLPMEEDVKELLYDLGQRYEAVHDVHGAREVYKIIFASDITFRDVKGKLETLAEAGGENMGAERTAIMNSLSEEAKRRYELVQELGRGAMGIVYKARDNELEEFVALKILPDNLIRNSEAVRRFKQEARNARRLSHPNIVRIHDIGEEMGRKYISMEFVEGSDLKQKIRELKRKLPFPTVLRYARQIAEAMSYAHSIGIVHRDIKPANLMLTNNDTIKVTDFGIAKMVESTASPDSTMAGAIIGTPLYMSPEQVKGLQVDHRADIYSMGIVYYEMASGRPPFNEGDLAYQHLFVEPKPLKDVPESFSRVVMKCLAKEKENRWQSAREILDELSKIPENGD
jgi:serine/threonine-protein kinase